jgi:BclB C-terminal domain-containing protein
MVATNLQDYQKKYSLNFLIMKTSTFTQTSAFMIRAYRLISLYVVLMGLITSARAQVGIGTTNPHGSAQLDINSSSKGVLIPRMTKNDRDLIDSPATGLLVFQTDYSPGFYFFNGSSWASISPAAPAATSSEAVVSLSSGTKVVLTTDAAGQANGLWYVGSGASEKEFLAAFSNPPASRNLISSKTEYAFSVPRSGIVTSISIAFKTTASTIFLGDNAPSTSTLTAQLYRNTSNDDIFQVVPDAKVTFLNNGQTLGDFSNTVAKAVASNLNVAVNAGDRLLIAFFFSQTGGPSTTFLTEITGFASAGISIK